MKITGWDDKKIYFNDGSYLYYHHRQDCCEHNYADFSVLEFAYDGEEFKSVDISPVEDAGFLLKLDRRHGNQFISGFGPEWNTGRIEKIFIPCYSEQNGYYTTEIVIAVKDKDGDIRKEVDLYANMDLV